MWGADAYVLGAAGVLSGAVEHPALVADDAVELPAFAVVVAVEFELLPQAVRAIIPAVAMTAAMERRVQLVIAGEANGLIRRIGIRRVVRAARDVGAPPGRTSFLVRHDGVPTGPGTCKPVGR
jgi:hypothetical protein